MPSTGKLGFATRARRPGIRTAEGRGKAVSGLGKDTGDIHRLMSPGIMGKGPRYSYGYCWESFRGDLFSHEVGVASGQVGAESAPSGRSMSAARRGRWTTTSEPEREGDGMTSCKVRCRQMGQALFLTCPSEA